MSVRSRLEAAERAANGEAPVAPVVGVIPSPDPAEEQDPSMPGIPTVSAPTASLAPAAPDVPPVAVVPPVAAPVVAPVVPAALPEKRHTWQPTDENGKPIGGVQVIVYRTEQEKFEQMQEKTVLLLRQLRKERREKALGVPERIDDAEKFQNVVEFKPRELSADERFQISQGIASPDTFADARDKLLESAFGVKPAVLAATLNDLQRREIQSRAVENYLEFVQSAGFEDTLEIEHW